MKRAWILGTLCLALTASAQEPEQEPEQGQGPAPIEGHAFLTPDRWSKLGKDELGKAFYAEGRWLECSGDEVLLLDLTDAQRGFFYIDPNSRLQRRLTQDLTPAGQALVRRKSKARLFGKVRKNGLEFVVEIARVDVLTSDSERLVAALNALGQEAPEAYAALVTEAKQLAQRYDDDELRTLADAIARRQAQVEAKLLDPANAQGALDLARRMLSLKDRLGAIALLARAEENVSEEAEKTRLRARLKELGATQSGGQWRSYEAFKTDEGFVQLPDKRWVRPETLEFDQMIEKELADQQGQLVIVRENPVEAARAADAGRLKRGQNAAEARIAVGMPLRVAHQTRKNPLGEEVTWSQWITKDGRRAYFMNGEVVRAIAADTPWPKPPQKPK